MRNSKGITMITLTITIVVMLILAGITTYFGKDLIQNVKLQDLRTNMLLIQAKAKECVEEVSFKKANVPDTETEKIENIKTENLKGTKISENSEVQNLVNNIGTEEGYEYYYLSEQELEEMGIKDSKIEDYGYFVVGYNIQEITVEVINTKGYKGNYTLKQLNELTGE